MSRKSLFFCSLALLAVARSSAQQPERVQVDVYYESTCPDSIKFINTQLHPALTTAGGNVSRYVQLQLVPFGKSSYTKNPLGETEFTCHHGPEECRGNKIHACAIDRIGNATQPSPGLGFNAVTLDYVSCLMEKVDRTNRSDVKFPIEQCAGMVDRVRNANEIETCSEHTAGVTLLEHYGELTDQLQKPLRSVPTVVFDGRYKEEDSKLAQSDFVRALCQHIKGERPAECARNGAAGVALALPLAALLACLVALF